MKLLRMRISGKMAHFRKYYANNTALSYFIPPRTTLMGMLAAIVGHEKDSYYESLSSEKIRIGVGIQHPVKKSFHRLNLLMIKGKSDFRGQKGRIQTPFEVVTGYEINRDMVSYEIYVSYHGEKAAFFDLLCEQLNKQGPVFSLSLGPANMSGFISDYQIIDQLEIQELQAEDEDIMLHTAVNSNYVNSLNWEQNHKLLVEEELMPADFIANKDRELKKMIRLLYTTDGQALPINYSGTYWQINTPQSRNITFIE